MYCYQWYREASRLSLRNPGSKNTTDCGDCLFWFFFLLTYETDQIDSRYQSASHHYRPFESWPLLLLFSFLSATPFFSVHSSYQTFLKWFNDQVSDRVRRETSVEDEGKILAVRLSVCYWCSDTEKCSASFSETHSAWGLCSLQALAWFPTWDIPVPCWFKKKKKKNLNIMLGGAQWVKSCKIHVWD